MRIIGAVVIVLVILFAGILMIRNLGPKNQNATTTEEVDIKASFTIITDNITRSFKAEKYHHQSSDVFITNDNPSVVFVKKKGATWQDFFNTLPMKLTKDCLITGDGETLCNGQQGRLDFYLNDSENENLLDKEIREADQAKIIFTSN